MNDLLDIDRPEPIGLTEAAKLVGRSKAALQAWISRGLLQSLAKDRHGHIVDRREVFRLHEATKHRQGCSIQRTM